jgi:hypothetical protein
VSCGAGSATALAAQELLESVLRNNAQGDADYGGADTADHVRNAAISRIAEQLCHLDFARKRERHQHCQRYGKRGAKILTQHEKIQTRRLACREVG